MNFIINRGKPYKLGIAFSGGGAKGAAHCGALQAMQEFDIKADIVAGTSAGSIAAVLYSSGFTPIEIANKFMLLDFKDLLGRQMPRGGLFDPSPLEALLKEIIPYERIEDLPVKTVVVATSLERGCTQLFEEGEMAPRVTASCAIPIIYQPVEIEGEHYSDGGVLMNLPVNALRDRCEKVIALNLHHAQQEAYKNSLYSNAMRCLTLMFLSNTMSDAPRADLLIDIDTADFSAYDLSQIEILYNIGYVTAVKTLEENGYERKYPQAACEFIHKDKQGAVEGIKMMAHEMMAKSGGIRESAKEMLQSAAHKKKQS